MSDVRELLPEIFYLPLMLMNKNHIDFGINQKKNRVHDVLLPEIFDGNPYRFVFAMRKNLESRDVSEELNNWIDLIFGYKQKGKEAIKAENIFYYLTYEDNVSQLVNQDPKTLAATQT